MHNLDFQAQRVKTNPLLRYLECLELPTVRSYPHLPYQDSDNDIELYIKTATSLLDVLRAPRPSDLTRKIKLQCNPGKP